MDAPGQSGCLIRLAQASDIDDLAPRLRDADCRELDLAEHGPPKQALTESLENSKIALSLLDPSGRVQTMFGVAWSGTPRVGIVWLLSSDFIQEQPLAYLRLSRPCITLLADGHDVIANNVHDENKVSLNWLRWLGFEATQHHPDFGKGAPFTMMARFSSAQVREMYLNKFWPGPADIESALMAQINTQRT